MATFMALITYGDRAKRDEARPKHREYLQKLLDEGKLHESGPFTDDSGAAIIYHAADAAEARDLLENDPYSAAGALSDTRIAKWNILFSDNE
ncbi:MAG: YciI family protein [Thermomicrobiales bacterium]